MGVAVSKRRIHHNQAVSLPALERQEIIVYNMHIQSAQKFLLPLQCLILCGFLSGVPVVTVPFAVVLFLLVELINPVAYLIQLLAAKLIPKDGTQIGASSGGVG